MSKENPDITTIRVHKDTRDLLNQEKNRRGLPSVEALLLAHLKDGKHNLDIPQALRILRAYDDAFGTLADHKDAFEEVRARFLAHITPEDIEVLWSVMEKE